jgi:hypothetical protein
MVRRLKMDRETKEFYSDMAEDEAADLIADHDILLSKLAPTELAHLALCYLSLQIMEGFDPDQETTDKALKVIGKE